MIFVILDPSDEEVTLIVTAPTRKVAAQAAANALCYDDADSRAELYRAFLDSEADGLRMFACPTPIVHTGS